MPARPARRTCTGCGANLASDNRSDVCGPCSRRTADDRLTAPLPPADFWSRPDVVGPLRERHFGRFLRAYRAAMSPPVTQAEAGRWLDLTQGQVSRVERATVPVRDLDRLERWSLALRIPPRLLWFTPSGQPHDAYTMGPPVPTVDEPPGGERSEEDVRRRDAIRVMGAAAGSGLLPDAPWNRVADTVARGQPADQVTARLVADRTAQFYDDEEITPARLLIDGMRRHRQALAVLVGNTSREDVRRRLLVASAETDALAGWLLFDRGRIDQATRVWTRALGIARDVGDGPLMACVLTYQSYLTASRGDQTAAMSLLRRAERHVSGTSAPATRSWIAAMFAEQAGRAGDVTTALRAADRAMLAFDFADPRTERPWTRFFSADRLGGSIVTTYTTVDHRDSETAADSLIRSVSAVDNKVRALVLADLATATAHNRDYERSLALAEDAIRTATTTEAPLAKARLRDLAAALPARAPGTARDLRDRITTGLRG